MSPSNCKEPIILKPKPSLSFQRIAMDFCSYGWQQFLITVDCLTDWPEIIPMQTNTSTQHLVQSLMGFILPHGGPGCSVVRRRAPVHFNDIAKQWGFEYKQSSPHYPQSNGKIEAMVKSMKNIILGTPINEHQCHVPSTIAIQKHTITQRWAIPSSETIQ